VSADAPRSGPWGGAIAALRARRDDRAVLDLDLALRVAAALGLGLLLGLERERVKDPETGFAGVRTFALISLSGATAAYAESALELAWIVPLTFAALGVLVAVSHLATSARGKLGITTEVSALLAFLLGALCLWGHVQVAAALAVAALLLLALKDALHGLAQRIEPTDVAATLRFAIITGIVLPLLPDRGYGPPSLEVVNPHQIWLMVVLISGLNFLGYIAVKVLGERHGFSVTGLLGGLVSSTALTLGFSHRSREQPTQSRALALGIVLAWSVMFFRIVALVAVVSPALAGSVASGLALLGAAGLAVAFLMARLPRPAGDHASVSSGHNPFELGESIRFGLLFGAVTFAAHAAQLWAGDRGLYAAGALAGLADVDAIALSMAQLALAQPGSASAAARTILIAVLANTGVKLGMVFALGAAALRRRMLPVAAALAVAGAAAWLLAGRTPG
jgi:uncharacterized membrane protein (DUF4010 family)